MKRKIISCIAATTNDDFSYHNLSTFCYNIKKSKIFIYNEFINESAEIVGKLLYGEIVDKTKLLIISEVYAELIPCYIVPGFKNNSIRPDIYTDIELICMGSVITPIDSTVTIFKEITW